MTKEQLKAAWGKVYFNKIMEKAQKIADKHPSPIHGNVVAPDLMLAVAIKDIMKKTKKNS